MSSIQDFLSQAGINYNQNEEGASKPGNYTNAQGGALWDAANPMYGGISMTEGETPEQYMERIHSAASDPSYGSAGLNYGDLSSGNGFFNGIPRVTVDGKQYMRVGQNLGSFTTDPLAQSIINKNGGMSALTKNDPTYGTLFDVSSPAGQAAYQQLSELGDKRHNTLNDQAWFNMLKLAAVAAGGAYAGGAGVGAEGAAAAAAPAAGSSVSPVWGELGGLSGGGELAGATYGPMTGVSGTGDGLLNVSGSQGMGDASFTDFVNQYSSPLDSTNPLDSMNFADPSSGLGTGNPLLDPSTAGGFTSGTAGGVWDAALANASNTPWYQQLVQKFGEQQAKALATKALQGGSTGQATQGLLSKVLNGTASASDYATLVGGAGLLGAGLLENPDRTTTVTKTNPDWYTQASQKALGAADAYAAQGAGAVAPLSANERQAGNLASSSAGNYQPYIDKATAATDKSALGIPGVDLKGYMNPYLESVLDPILRRGKIDKANAIQGIDASAAAHNAYGSSRAGLMSQQAGESADRTLNETEANIRSGAFNTGVATAGKDLDRIAAAGAQYGALGNYVSNLTGQDVSRLSTTGATDRSIDQATRNVPLVQSAAYKGALPTNTNQTTTTTGPAGSKLGALTGALTAIYGMS